MENEKITIDQLDEEELIEVEQLDEEERNIEDQLQEENQAVENLKKEPKKVVADRRMTILCLILLCICTLLLGCSLYYWEKAKTVEIPVVAEPVEKTYSEEELEKAKAEAVQEAIASYEQQLQAESSVENVAETSDALEQIKYGLEEGKSLLDTLRPMYPNHVIVYTSGRYQFFPIIEELKKTDFTPENVLKMENGEKQYAKDGVIISHKGIDVSKHQGSIDWKKVADSGVEFAMIRVGVRGYGSGKIVEDERYEENLKGAISNGLKVGVYFFSQAVDESEAVEEAEFVLERILPFKVDGPVVLDVEKVEDKGARMNALSREDRTDVALAFLQRVEQQGYKGMLYFNTEAGIAMLEPERLEDYEKWYAYYGEEPVNPYDYSIWQYSDKGKIPGISEKVDLNIAFRLWE